MPLRVVPATTGSNPSLSMFPGTPLRDPHGSRPTWVFPDLPSPGCLVEGRHPRFTWRMLSLTLSRSGQSEAWKPGRYSAEAGFTRLPPSVLSCDVKVAYPQKPMTNARDDSNRPGQGQSRGTGASIRRHCFNVCLMCFLAWGNLSDLARGDTISYGL